MQLKTRPRSTTASSHNSPSRKEVGSPKSTLSKTDTPSKLINRPCRQINSESKKANKINEMTPQIMNNLLGVIDNLNKDIALYKTEINKITSRNSEVEEYLKGFDKLVDEFTVIKNKLVQNYNIDYDSVEQDNKDSRSNMFAVSVDLLSKAIDKLDTLILEKESIVTEKEKAVNKSKLLEREMETVKKQKILKGENNDLLQARNWDLELNNQELQNEVDAYKTKINKYEIKIKQIEGNMKRMQENIIELKNSENKLKQDIEDRNNNYSLKLKDTNNTLNRIRTEKTECLKTIKSLELELINTKNTPTKLETMFNQDNNEYETLKEKNVMYKKDTEKYKALINKLKNERNIMKKEIIRYENKVDLLKKDLLMHGATVESVCSSSITEEYFTNNSDNDESIKNKSKKFYNALQLNETSINKIKALNISRYSLPINNKLTDSSKLEIEYVAKRLYDDINKDSIRDIVNVNKKDINKIINTVLDLLQKDHSPQLREDIMGKKYSVELNKSESDVLSKKFVKFIETNSSKDLSNFEKTQTPNQHADTEIIEYTQKEAENAYRTNSYESAAMEYAKTCHTSETQVKQPEHSVLDKNDKKTGILNLESKTNSILNIKANISKSSNDIKLKSIDTPDNQVKFNSLKNLKHAEMSKSYSDGLHADLNLQITTLDNTKPNDTLPRPKTLPPKELLQKLELIEKFKFELDEKFNNKTNKNKDLNKCFSEPTTLLPLEKETKGSATDIKNESLSSTNMNLNDDGFMNNNDPELIYFITQTMIGEYLVKFTKSSIFSSARSRHERYFWIHPYTKTINWSIEQPNKAGISYIRNGSFSRSAYIVSVNSIKDYVSDSLPEESIMITTPNRKLKVKAKSQPRHEMWLKVLTFLQSRVTNNLEEIVSNESWNESFANNSINYQTVHTARPLSERSNIKSPSLLFLKKSTKNFTNLVRSATSRKSSINGNNFG